MMRSMIIHSSLTKSLWGEVPKTTVYLLNRDTTKVMDKTLYELWTDKKPSIKLGTYIFGVVQLRLSLTGLMKSDNSMI